MGKWLRKTPMSPSMLSTVTQQVVDQILLRYRICLAKYSALQCQRILKVTIVQKIKTCRSFSTNIHWKPQITNSICGWSQILRENFGGLSDSEHFSHVVSSLWVCSSEIKHHHATHLLQTMACFNICVCVGPSTLCSRFHSVLTKMKQATR